MSSHILKPPQNTRIESLYQRYESYLVAVIQRKAFRFRLREAMQQLHDNGVINDWRITENDALEFSRGDVDNWG